MTDLAANAIKRARIRAIGAVVLVALTACSGTSSTSGSPAQSATGPLADVVLRPLPAVDDITFVSVAEAELELIAEMRTDAGFVDLLAPNGDAILAGLDEASREQGEAALPAFATELGLDLSASLEVAAMPGAPGWDPPAPDEEWSGSLLGQTSGTISMTMGMMAGVIGIADQPGDGSLSRPEHYTKTAGGTTETIDITTSYRITSGGGRVSADIDISSTDVITDASGSQIASLTGTGHGHIEVNACPAADGQAAGTYVLEWEEVLSQGGGSGATTHYSNTAPFTLWDGDDAHWTRIDTTMNLERGASGPGTAGGDWSVTASVPMTIPKSGKTVVGYDLATVEGTGSPDQVNRTVNGTFSSQQFLIEVAKEAERFWRSGKCIELTTSEESRDVDPEEEISLSVDAMHRFDGAQVKAPITASFSGKEKLEPANTPLDPPASFDFTAGSEPDETGTIDLKQTSRRGIGLKTIQFKVKGGDLLVTYDGSLDVPAQTGGFTGSFVLADVKLEGTGTTLTGSGSVQITGSVVAGPCSAPVNNQVDATVTATRDEADTELVHVALAVSAGTVRVTMTCPEGLTFAFPLFSAIQLWSASLQTPVAVAIDGSATVPAAAASGSTTITVEKVEPPS